MYIIMVDKLFQIFMTLVYMLIAHLYTLLALHKNSGQHGGYG